MQYQQETGKVVMNDGPYITVVQPMLLANDSEIRHTRKILIILISICLGLCAIGVVSSIVQLATEKNSGQNQESIQVIQSVASLLLYGLGFFATYKYYKTSLRVFAWLCIIDLIWSGIMIGISFVVAIRIIFLVDPTINNAGTIVVASTIVLVVLMIMSIAGFAVTIIIVQLAFKLARFIDANKHLTIQSV